MFEINLDNFTKKEENTKIENITKNPNERSLEELFNKGFFIIDKDCGPTSHSVCSLLKSLLEKNDFNITKIGHSGTLDPKVSGVLVCGINKATKLMEYMLLSSKRYICLMYFHNDFQIEELKKVIKSFVGKIKQTPPIISAVKRVEREREIYSLKILEIKGRYVLFDVSCERGTYIRKLCFDIGVKLKVNSQMVELRRVKAGSFSEDENIISLDKIRNLLELYKEDKKYENVLRKYLMPYECLVRDFKKIIVCDTTLESLKNGSDLKIPGIIYFEKGIRKNDFIAILSSKFELVAIGKSTLDYNDILKNEKGICVKTNKVFFD